MTPYFAYGSNMSTPRLVQRVGEVRILGSARLEGYEHRFSKRGNDGTAKGNVERVDGAVVWGVLYELAAEQLVRLRGFESGYRQVGFSISFNAAPVHAVSFEALEIVRGLEPTPAYLSHYLEGMREHRLPPDYQRQLFVREGLSPGEP